MGLYVNTGHIKTIISVEVQPGDRISTGNTKWRTKNPDCQPPYRPATTARGITRASFSNMINIYIYLYVHQYVCVGVCSTTTAGVLIPNFSYNIDKFWIAVIIVYLCLDLLVAFINGEERVVKLKTHAQSHRHSHHSLSSCWDFQCPYVYITFIIGRPYIYIYLFNTSTVPISSVCK